MLRFVLYIIFVLNILLLSTSRSRAQAVAGGISIEDGGELWIEGSAGIIDYRCKAEKLSGAGEIENAVDPQSSIKAHGHVHILVTLPVKSLDCGKRAMNKDMYKALKADSFANIHYTLLDATRDKNQTPNTATSWMPIRTHGLMEIAGVQDTTTIFVQGKILSDNRFRVKGSKQIHMDTFHIKPPTAMFGLIKADKNLTVHFDVTVQLADTTSFSGY